MGWEDSTHWLDHSVHECDWFLGGSQLADEEWGPFVSITVQALLNGSEDPCRSREGQSSEEYKQIGLYSNGLRGTIPQELFLLTGLETINFVGNSIAGTIPKDVGKMDHLQP